MSGDQHSRVPAPLSDHPLRPRKNVLARAPAYLLALLAGFGFVYGFAVGLKFTIAFVGMIGLFSVVALFVADLRSFLLFSLIFCVPLQIDYHLVYERLEMESTLFMSGITVDITEVVLAAAYFLWAASAALYKQGHRLTLGGSVGGLLLLWIACGAITSFLAADRFRFSVYELIALSKGFLIYFYVVNNIRGRRDLRTVIAALFATTAAHALYILFQFATRLNYTLQGEPQPYIGPEGFRSIGFFGSPDAAAALISFIIPIGIAYYLIYRKRPERPLILVGLVVALAAIMATKVRAAGLAVLISTMVVFLIAHVRHRITSATLFKGALVAIIALILISPAVYDRFQRGSWGEQRLPLMETSINMIKDHPVFGVGLNNYPFNIEEYVPVRFRGRWEYTVHNEYLLRLAEGGAVGFVVYYALNIVFMLLLWRLTKSSDTLVYVLGVGLFAVMIGSIPHRFFSFFHYVNFYNQFCVLLAAGAATALLERRKSGRETSEREGEIGTAAPNPSKTTVAARSG